MKKLYKATAVMGIATFVAMLTGVIKAKFMAIVLGPVGVGIYSQAATFFQSAETLCGLGIGLGITKYVAQVWSEKKTDELEKTMSAFLLLQSISFAIFFILVSAFSSRLSQFLFASTQYSWTLILVSGAVLFSILTISMESALLGLGRSDIFSKARVIYYVAGVVLLIVLVGTMKLMGGFIFIALNGLISLAVVYLFLSRLMKSDIRISFISVIRRIKEVDFRAYSAKLISYGVVTLAASTFSWVAILYVRSLLIKHEGAVSNGLYQVVFALVSYYTPFFTNGLWGHLFPRLSAIKDIEDFNVEVNAAIRFILLFVSPAIVTLFLLRRFLVVLIFSGEFLGSLELFPLYLFGSLFFMISYVAGTVFLASKKLKIYFVINLLQSLVLIIVFKGFVGRFGLFAIALAYFAMNIFAAAASILYQTYRMRLKINIDNMRLFALSILLVSVAFFLPVTFMAEQLFGWALLVLWALLVIGRKEKALLLSFIKVR